MPIDLEQLQDSPHLLDILLQMEDVLDSMDVYVFKNWLKGEIVEGPVVRRYWLDMTLRYPFEDMPDPRAGLRLLKHKVRVDFEKARYEDSEKGNDTVEKNEDEAEASEDENLCWLVRISIPRHLVVQISDAQHDFYDEEIDAEDVEDAKDLAMDDEESGLTDETTLPTDGQEPQPDEGGQNAPPPQGGRQ